jgi:hypothetical protein
MQNETSSFSLKYRRHECLVRDGETDSDPVTESFPKPDGNLCFLNSAGGG